MWLDPRSIRDSNILAVVGNATGYPSGEFYLSEDGLHLSTKSKSDLTLTKGN